mgnify:CR=1 FL=1
MNIKNLQATLRNFAAERDWEQFHNPKNLAMALSVEAAELLEIFQWMTSEQAKNAHRNQLVKERIADEIADVFLYLVQIADKSDVDLENSILEKIKKNAIKHPSKLTLDNIRALAEKSKLSPNY